MEYAESLIGKYVILKPEYWDTEIETGFLDSYGNPEYLKMTDTNYSNVGEIIKEIPRIGYAFMNNGDGTIEVQTGFFMPDRGTDFETINANMLTTFKVALYADAEVRDGSLGDPSAHQIGTVIRGADEDSDYDDGFFLVENNQTGTSSWYDTNEFDIQLIPDERISRARNVSSMIQTSRRGLLEHFPLVGNTRGVIMEYLTGLRLRGPNETTFERRYRNALRNQIFGRPPRNALNNGPLPYGPTEENFMGGKSKRKARKTRRRKRSTK